MEAFLGTQTTFFFTKYFVRTGNPCIWGEKTEYYFVTKFNKYGRCKLHSFETDIDAQPCNVSYVNCKLIMVIKNVY